jgi:uncharacterized membrane protein YeaQ/YmgE (transglycosylase-associated protein family)
MGLSHVLAWVCIGLAASLAGCIWPFRRGVGGLVVNAIAALAGAVGAGLVFVAATQRPANAPATLAVAAIGAVAALLLVHASWSLLGRTAAARQATRHASHR